MRDVRFTCNERAGRNMYFCTPILGFARGNLTSLSLQCPQSPFKFVGAIEEISDTLTVYKVDRHHASGIVSYTGGILERNIKTRIEWLVSGSVARQTTSDRGNQGYATCFAHGTTTATTNLLAPTALCILMVNSPNARGHINGGWGAMKKGMNGRFRLHAALVGVCFVAEREERREGGRESEPRAEQWQWLSPMGVRQIVSVIWSRCQRPNTTRI